jgi:tetratricopeptide (TPR) repeat protein
MITAIRILGTAWSLALLFAIAPASDVHGADSKVEVVAFGLFGDQSVFESEAKGAAQIVASRFGGGPVIVRANTKSREEATSDTLAATLQSTAKTMNVDNDILFLILTSHGSRAGLAVKTPNRKDVEILSPLDLFTMLDRTQVRHRIVIVSACYSGVFIPPLADPDTLVITAADADHPSFGCRNGNAWTYFGDAFFNMALRRTADLRDAFALAKAAIRQREVQNRLEPSNPQIAGGENIERLLKSGPDRVPEDAGRLDPRYAPAKAGRGDAYEAKGDIDHAIAAYNEAIRLDPKYALAYADRGLAYRAKGDLDHALADSDAAIALDPKLAAAYNSRGSTYLSKGDKDRAIADFDEAIRLDPKRFFLYTNRGVAFAAKGDNDHAIADYNEAVRLEPKYIWAYYHRGVAYGAKGDNVRAIADFNQAIKLNPKFSSAYGKRGLAYRARGDNTRAEADLKEAARLKAPGPQP